MVNVSNAQLPSLDVGLELNASQQRRRSNMFGEFVRVLCLLCTSMNDILWCSCRLVNVLANCRRRVAMPYRRRRLLVLPNIIDALPK